MRTSNRVPCEGSGYVDRGFNAFGRWAVKWAHAAGCDIVSSFLQLDRVDCV